MKWGILTLLSVIFIIFLVGNVSAFEFDNAGRYDEETKTMTIKNGCDPLGLICLGEDIATVQLKSDPIQRVGLGYQKVAEFEIKQLVDYNNVLKELELFDKKKGNNKFLRDYDFKVLSYENYTDYQYGNDLITGEYKSFGTETRIREVWTKLTPSDFKKNENLTIGIFTEVEMGDHVEWIPNIMGVRISEWAEWTADLNVGLNHYYNLSSASDSVGGIDLTENGGITFTPGLIEDGVDGSVINTGKSLSTSDTWGIDGDAMAISVWINNTASVTVDSGIVGTCNQASDVCYFLTYDDGGGTPLLRYDRFKSGVGGGLLSHTVTLADNSSYQHVVIAYDGAISYLYFNSVLVNTAPFSGNGSTNPPQGSHILDNAQAPGLFFNGKADEVGVWGRNITQTEVTQLYNGGLGITHTDIFAPVITLNSPIDFFNTTNPNIDFNGTATGTSVSNITFYIDGIFNETNSSPINGEPTIFSKILGEGQQNWTYEACNNQNECSNETRTVSVDFSNPSLIITFPNETINFHAINTNLFVNWSVNDTFLDTCILEYEGSNTTLTCIDNSTSINITTILNKSLTIYVNDTFGFTNQSSVTWDYKIFQETITYDSSIFETGNATFSINVSANSSLTNTNLIHDGTTYSSTQNGNLYTTSLDVSPSSGTKSFYWNFTYAGGEINSSSNNQEVKKLFFQYCNSTFSTPFLNFTFKDETDDSDLNATNDLVDMTFWIGGGTQTKSYINTTTSDSDYYAFCSNAVNDTITLDSTFKYSKTGYPLRTFSYVERELTNATTNQTLYLLATADGIYSSISVIESSGNTIEGVGIQIERQFAGIWTIISQDVTGSDGVATFWVNPNFKHRITASKTGYVTTKVTITPSQSIYTLTLSRTSGEAEYTSDLPGIKWIALPQSGSIDVGTRNFNVTVTSSESNLENCKFELVNATNLSHTLNSVTSFTNSSYCFLGMNYNAQGDVKIFGRLSLDTTTTDGFVIVNADWKWITIDIDAKAWRSVTSFFADMRTLSEFGEGNKGDFSRIITFFLMTTILFGVFIYFTRIELTSPGVTILLIWGITLFASAGGFLTFNSGSENVNSAIRQYGFFFIFTIYMINYFLTIIRRANE